MKTSKPADSPPAWSTKLEALSHRECLIPFEWCGVFVREYPSQKSRTGFMEPYPEKEENIHASSPALSSVEGLSTYSSKEPWRLFSPHVLVWKN
jgi:hypothetical protein